MKMIERIIGDLQHLQIGEAPKLGWNRLNFIIAKDKNELKVLKQKLNKTKN